MPLAQDLKDILACPKCKGALEHVEGAGEALEELRCLRCRLAYRVEDGIPVMLVDEARPLA